MDPDIIKKYFTIDTTKLCNNENILRIRNWKIIKVDFPVFIVSMLHPKSQIEYCFLFLCEEFPISLQIVDPVNLMPVPYTGWPKGGSFLSSHSKTERPFLCSPGIREYHTHSSHENETQWVFTSPDFRLPVVIDTVYTHLLRSDS